MEKMKPWNKGFIQQRSFNMAQPKDSQTQTQTLERPEAQQPNSDGWGIGPQRTLINPGSWGQPVIPGLDTSMQMEWLSGLPKDERLEAKRLELQKNFSWDGFQVIRHQASPFDPVMTVRGKSVTFNNACISKLERATYINFLINVSKMLLVIRPVREGARHAVRWCVVKGEKRKSRQITCRRFTEKLFRLTGWNPEYRYKLKGWIIDYMGENLYVFDLTEVEGFIPQHRDPVTGKIPKAKPVPEEKDTFGMSVEENEASMNVDLREGFIDIDEEETIPDQTDAEPRGGGEMPSGEVTS